MIKSNLTTSRILLSLSLLSAFAFTLLWNKQERPLFTEKQTITHISNGQKSASITSLHGHALVTEPVLIDLLNTPVMQRLNGINQGGVCHFAEPKTPPYNRYEHCIDVFLLLRHYGATLEEQIAGLLHDASHTVFSHVGDFIFKNTDEKNSYQDNIHTWFLKRYGIEEVLAKHGYTIDDILHKCGSFSLLEQHLPDLCIDRIQYNYHTGFIDGIISSDEVRQGYNHLHYKDGIWSFDNPKDAARLGRISLHETVHFWGSAWNLLIYEWTAQAMRRAMNLGLVSMDDIHFDVQDKAMWDRLLEINDPMIQYMMHKIQNYNDQFKLISEQEFELLKNNPSVQCQNMKFKFRGVDPWVETEEGLKRLTQIDASYAQAYAETKAQAEKGWFILFENINKQSHEEQALYAQAEAILKEQEGELEKDCIRLT